MKISSFIIQLLKLRCFGIKYIIFYANDTIPPSDFGSFNISYSRKTMTFFSHSDGDYFLK